jgi:outer membrane protein TolC
VIERTAGFNSLFRFGETMLTRKSLCCLLGVLLAAAEAMAQQPQPDYTKPRSHFPNFIAPYSGRTVEKASVANSTRAAESLADGKLRLSLSDAIALALENNLDLAIARYNLQIADTDILRTKAGADARGVASGLVQGTPGGGIGGFGSGAPGAGAGGTSGGAGGAGTGAGGLVQSTIGTGAPVQSYDPALTSIAQIEHAIFPLTNTVTTGTPQFNQNSATVNFNYNQAWATGTSLQVGVNNDRVTSNSLFETLVPAITSSFRATVRQRLLSGFGLGPNTRFIRIAKNNREISDIAFRNQVVATVTQIQNIYWDLVNAAEELKVRQRSVALAQKTLDDNRKQAELQAIAPIEVMRAESELDARRQELITAETAFQLQQLLMKNAVMRDVAAPAIAAAEVIPTDTMTVAQTEPVVPTQDLIADALAHRPELAQARIDLTNREITRKAARNALLPAVDLVAFYGGTGQAGVQNPFLADVPPTPLPSTGFSEAFRRGFNGSSPDYAVGFQMNIPLRNRAAQADQVRSELEYRQAELRYQQLQNQIRIEVQNAQFAVTQNRARVESARKARDLAQRTYEIEQKKLALGASTSLSLLQVGRDLALAESNLVAATTTYQKSRVELDRVIGTTLEHNGISMDDAELGHVRNMPVIPGVATTTDR